MEDAGIGAQREVAEVAPSVDVDLEIDSTIGYASIQNSVPVVRSLRITNRTDGELRDLEVLIRCNPGFAKGDRLVFDKLASGETRSMPPLDLQPDHGYLSELQETVTAAVTVTVVAGTVEVVSVSQTIEVMAYDQWAGTRSLPELLAAFSMPNNPAVDAIIGKASKLLRDSNPELSMNGYQSKSREVVWKQISALYSTIGAENLQYAEPPASFGNDGQKIRTPDRILEGRVATCLDLAMLFASCLEQAGLRPVILIKQGHAWVGAWLHQASFPFPLTDDVQAVRKRVDTGEFLAFETTGVAQHRIVRPSLRIALEQGARHFLDEGGFLFAVDVHVARGAQIKPLPSKSVLVRGAEEQDVDPPGAIEPTPQLPPLDPAVLAPIELPTAETPEGRLAKWKGKLLDLTLRNKLLNFKPTKASLQLVAPDLAALEDSLATGKEFKIKPLPTLMEGVDPRSAQVHAGRTGRTPLDDMALECLGNQEIIGRAAQEALDANLLALFSAARTGQEEGGANTLYLALGMLKWRQVERPEVVHLAPLILVPVSLTRQSVKSGFRLTRHDDETIINPTLLQLLKSAFELNIPGLDITPTDDSGVDVNGILQAFRLGVRDIAGWEVDQQAYLGIFSFTKYLMWKDLHERTAALRTNRVVNHLIEHPGEVFATEARDERHDRLDEEYKPQDILAPMLSDSSQLKAICAVDSGRDLVLEGPPGTGKSQTITNVIAHALGKGKSVLFVSEKMAALDVVHTRLKRIGLGAFSLELHSSKAKKAEVLQQLGAALAAPSTRTADQWLIEAERLARLRQDLNGLVTALHREHRNGLTAFNAIGICIANVSRDASDMPWADAEVHSAAELDGLRETSRKICALGQALSSLRDHPLAIVGQLEWSPSWQEEVLRSAEAVLRAAAVLGDRFEPIGKLLHLAPRGQSIESYAATDKLAEALLAAPKVPLGLAKNASDSVTRSRVAALVAHGRARQAKWSELGSGWTPHLAKINGMLLQGEWSQASTAWWPKSWFAKRSIRGRLAAVRHDSRPPSEDQLRRVVGPLIDVNEEDEFLRGLQVDAETLLQDSFTGIETDWSAVEAHNSWAAAFSEVVAVLAHTQSLDASGAQAVLSRLVPLVGEQRSMLLASGLVGASLIAYRDAYAELRGAVQKLEELTCAMQSLYGPPGADGVLERLRATLEEWKTARRDLRPWCIWRRTREAAVAAGLHGLIDSLESGAVPLIEAESHFEFSYQHWWLKKVFDRDPVLREFSSSDHERKIREFRSSDARFQKLTEEYIVACLSGRVPTATGAIVGADSEMGRLRRELARQRGHMPVRQLVQGLPTLLPRLKPCLLMSPLSVAQYLDARHAQFDLVVFDEASQIPVWDAIGVIARGKQVVVVGDPKQLPPTSFFAKSTDDGDGAVDSEQIDDLESILDECLGAGMNRLSLKWHYRSKHESLITFSNVRYYGSELVTFPSPVTEDMAVRFQPVAGVYDRGSSRTNRAEAEAVVAAIEAHFSKGSKSSVGVVTFNQTQQALIETLLDARRRQNSRLDRALAELKHEPLFIKNLENVQGDERDIIFFSITYGPDAAGKVTMNFGPLNGEGGHRRLNVAISRAREGVVIFSTLRPEQIDLSRVRAAGVRDLKHYLEFAIKGSSALLSQSLPTGLGPDSPFEVAVATMLRNKGWIVHPQVGCSGYRIDMAVVDPRAPGRYLLGIECDGASYHSGASARDRDRLRQHILEQLGWQMHRIWSTNWWFDAQQELDKLHDRLEALLSEQPDSPVSVFEAEADGVAAEIDQDALSAGVEPSSAPPSPNFRKADLPFYMPVAITGGTPNSFYEPNAIEVIKDGVMNVIAQEGPVLDSVVFKRVARAWGLERTGARIVERLKTLVPRDVVRTEDGDKTFYWPPGAKPDAWRTVRVAGKSETSKRHVDEVPVEEIGALVCHVLEEAGSSTRQDVARTACRLLGMARTPADAEARVAIAIARLVQAGVLSEDEGYLRKVP